jgi:hypothetical protein
MGVHDYGVLSIEDAALMDEMLLRVGREFDGKVKMLELGHAGGMTARGVKRFCDKSGLQLRYYGIDKACGAPTQPMFQGGIFHQGETDEIFDSVNEDFNLIFIDACHCNNHVILDFCNYGPRCVVNGYVMFHDTHPSSTWQGCHYQHHGPKIPAFHIQVRSALRKLGLLTGKRTDWELVKEETGGTGMGMMVYKKLDKL